MKPAILKILRSKKGNSYPLAICIALAIVIIATGAFEYMRLMLIAQGVRDSVQSSIIAVSTGNFSNVYASLREGHSGGFVNDGDGFNEQISLGDVYARLADVLGLTQDGDSYVKFIGGDVMEYRISNLRVTVINAPFAPTDRSAQQFLAEATIDLEVPLSFGWSALPPMRTTIRVRAAWTPRF